MPGRLIHDAAHGPARNPSRRRCPACGRRSKLCRCEPARLSNRRLLAALSDTPLTAVEVVRAAGGDARLDTPLALGALARHVLAGRATMKLDAAGNVAYALPAPATAPPPARCTPPAAVTPEPTAQPARQPPVEHRAVEPPETRPGAPETPRHAQPREDAVKPAHGPASPPRGHPAKPRPRLVRRPPDKGAVSVTKKARRPPAPCAGNGCDSRRVDGSRWCVPCTLAVGMQAARSVKRRSLGLCIACMKPCTERLCGPCERAGMRWPDERPPANFTPPPRPRIPTPSPAPCRQGHRVRRKPNESGGFRPDRSTPSTP